VHRAVKKFEKKTDLLTKLSSVKIIIFKTALQDIKEYRHTSYLVLIHSKDGLRNDVFIPVADELFPGRQSTQFVCVKHSLGLPALSK
jgi:hypothetical protein